MSISRKISVIIPCFNNGGTISETIMSVVRQTYADWELIVVDDGSTDNGFEIAKSTFANDGCIKFLSRDRGPKGACTCRNIGAKMAKGGFLFFLDADDLLSPLCLEQRINAFSSDPDNDLMIFSELVFKRYWNDTLCYWNKDTGEDDLLRFLRGDALVQTSGVIWKRDPFMELGGWDEALHFWQDLDLHLRAILKGCKYAKKMGLPPDVYIRISEDSMSRAAFNSPEKVKSRARVLEKVLSLLPDEKMDAAIRSSVRVMFGMVYIGASRSGRLLAAFHALRSCLSRGIIGPYEALVLAGYLFAHVSRLRLLSPVQKWADKVSRSFNGKNTIGAIPYAYSPADLEHGLLEEGRRTASAPSISVVIPVKNAEKTIKFCVEGILGQSLADNVCEIIVLDNASTDGTRSILSRYPKVRVIDIPSGEFSHGGTRNRGAKEARGELIALTVGDAWPADRYWLENLLSGFDAPNVAGVCGQQIVPHDPDKNPVQWFWPATGPTFKKIVFPKPEDLYSLTPGKKKEACGWDNVTAMYRRDVLLELPFREVAYGEDMAWAVDALLAGHALVYNTSARVCHYHYEDAELAYSRRFFNYYYRYKAFGLLPARDDEGKMPVLRAAYILAKERKIGARDKFKWLHYNIVAIRARKKAFRDFLRSYKDGEAAFRERLDLSCRSMGYAQEK